jgi:hypothetical protein
MSGWTKREPVSNLVILGDDEGCATRASGLLAAMTQDTMYPNRSNYELVQKNGESIHLAGSASLSRQIGVTDVGHFLKCEFKGWGKSANGKFKMVEVFIWNDEPTEAMKAWPRFAECQPGAAPKAAPKAPAKVEPKAADDFSDFPGSVDDSPDDLPF